jgi:hypothetical protein
MFIGKKTYPVYYRIYLNIKFEEHVRAKSYNCLWDSRIKKWYFNEEDYVKSGIKLDAELHKELCPYMILNNAVVLV